MEAQLDQYETEMVERMEEMKSCQRDRRDESCFNCESLLGCQLRERYVEAVYASMNKGTGGGFEF
ncbi:MAG: hypothetical protein LBE89_00665 [Helicobacteraceae bacterium]|jgi:hypothetical protein|nr:hypothetical protein [Helicobacteraceae bacterium]